MSTQQALSPRAPSRQVHSSCSLQGVRSTPDFNFFVGFTSNFPCALCQANAANLPCTDSKSSAAWLHACSPPASWQLPQVNRSCAFFRVPGLTACPYVPDIMHIKHLATDCYFLGTLPQYMLDKYMATAEQKNARLRDDSKAAYKALRIASPINRRSHCMFEAGENPFPKLKVKAADCRTLGQALLGVAGEKGILLCRWSSRCCWRFLAVRKLRRLRTHIRRRPCCLQQPLPGIRRLAAPSFCSCRSFAATSTAEARTCFTTRSRATTSLALL